MKNVMVKRIIKIICMLLVFFGLFVWISNILKEKDYFKIKIVSPETENWKAFYAEPKNSLDIIFLGSSHIYNDIDTVTFYKETGLRGFDMASSNQDPFLSYVYLQETLKYHKPDIVVFDAARFNGGVFSQHKYYEMSFDNMRFSKLKLDSIRTWKNYVPDEDIWNRIFTIREYHTRWEHLEQVDFSDKGLVSSINGYIPSTYVEKQEKMCVYDEDDELWPIPDLTASYIDNIQSLCIENDIELVVILTPDTVFRYGKAEATRQFLADRDITFIDYNLPENFERTGIDLSKDFRDKSHLNVSGAEKMTKTLADDLESLGVIKRTEPSDDRWQEKTKRWNDSRLELYLRNTTDMKDYLDILAETDYTVLISVCDEGTMGLTDTLVTKLAALGFDEYFYNGYQQSYYGIRDGSHVESVMGSEILNTSGELSNGKFYEITSIGWFAGASNGEESSAVIKIGDTDYAMGVNGMNIVVYDTKNDTVVDSVCFDTGVDTLDAIRY